MPAPLVHRFRNTYPNDLGAFLGNFNVPVFTSNTDVAFGFEIGAGSEIDVMQVRWRGGIGTIAVGAPLVGEFEGPFEFIPFAGREPLLGTYYTAGFSGMRSDELAPNVEIVQHMQPVAALGAARGPSTRQGRIQTIGTGYTAAAPLLAIPFYGRRRCTFRVIAAQVGAGGVTDLILTVVGRSPLVSPQSGTEYSFRDSLDYGLSKNPNPATGENGAFTMDCPIAFDTPGIVREITLTTAQLAAGAGGGVSSCAIDVESRNHAILALYAKSAATPTPYLLLATAECSDA